MTANRAESPGLFTGYPPVSSAIISAAAMRATWWWCLLLGEKQTPTLETAAAVHDPYRHFPRDFGAVQHGQLRPSLLMNFSTSYSITTPASDGELGCHAGVLQHRTLWPIFRPANALKAGVTTRANQIAKDLRHAHRAREIPIARRKVSPELKSKGSAIFGRRWLSGPQ